MLPPLFPSKFLSQDTPVCWSPIQKVCPFSTKWGYFIFHFQFLKLSCDTVTSLVTLIVNGHSYDIRVHLRLLMTAAIIILSQIRQFVLYWNRFDASQFLTWIHGILNYKSRCANIHICHSYDNCLDHGMFWKHLLLSAIFVLGTSCAFRSFLSSKVLYSCLKSYLPEL